MTAVPAVASARRGGGGAPTSLVGRPAAGPPGAHHRHGAVPRLGDHLRRSARSARATRPRRCSARPRRRQDIAGDEPRVRPRPAAGAAATSPGSATPSRATSAGRGSPPIPVSDSIKQALPVDLSIAALALVLAILIGGGAGIVAALEQRRARRPRGHRRLLGGRHAAAVRDRHRADRASSRSRLRLLPAGGYVAARRRPGPVAALLDPAGARAEPRRRRLHRPPAAHLAGRRARARTTPSAPRCAATPRRRVLFGHVLRNAVCPDARRDRHGAAADHRRRGDHREALRPARHRPARAAVRRAAATCRSSSAPCW